jgi:hypothetical protein
MGFLILIASQISSKHHGLRASTLEGKVLRGASQCCWGWRHCSNGPRQCALGKQDHERLALTNAAAQELAQIGKRVTVQVAGTAEHLINRAVVEREAVGHFQRRAFFRSPVRSLLTYSLMYLASAPASAL